MKWLRFERAYMSLSTFPSCNEQKTALVDWSPRYGFIHKSYDENMKPVFVVLYFSAFFLLHLLIVTRSSCVSIEFLVKLLSLKIFNLLMHLSHELLHRGARNSWTWYTYTIKYIYCKIFWPIHFVFLWLFLFQSNNKTVFTLVPGTQRASRLPRHAFKNKNHALCYGKAELVLGLAHSLTCFIWVTQQCLFLPSQSRARPVLHPGCYGELIRQVLRCHPVRNLSRLSSIKSEYELTVAPAICQQWHRPIKCSAGGGEKVSAAWRSS